MNKIYGYARCSTNESKQDINRQIRELIELGATKETIYKEYQSGTKINRVELNRLLDTVQQGDTIVVTEVSRISRSTKQLIDIIDLVKEKKLKLVIKNSLTVDCTNGELDPMTKAFIQISGVFAELERNMISERVKSGMDNAKDKGKQIGRSKTTVEEVKGNTKFMNTYKLYRDKKISKSDIAKICNMSRTTVYKYLELLEG
ncbi:recombinase family protein [Terrisporobacter petrolearius]|uniref:recombinase family protein n=1 Tax=Terrisporobacter petrolearius TaxID=1460447 RepID=UPI001D164CD7|nr:recombinase family protein [Terrisporobacter petrolearius]MCC3865351.1 recombinase family protein [Terrisporobacter petrolearius]